MKNRNEDNAVFTIMQQFYQVFLKKDKKNRVVLTDN